MKKILIPFLIVLSILLVLGAAWFLVQAFQQETTRAQGVVTYNETWTATAGTYGYASRSGANVYMNYANGIPGAGVACGYGYAWYQAGYGIASCVFSPTQWSVVGTINSGGGAGVKRYFITSRFAYYNYDNPPYGNLQTLTASFCNNDPNNPGGYFHPYLGGASGRFVPDGTTVQGPYGTGRSGFDTYISDSPQFWSKRNGEYSYLQSGHVLGGMTYRGTNTYYYRTKYILCVED